MSDDRGAFADGGVVSDATRGDDSVPVILSRGCVLWSREQAEAIGLTTEAKHLPAEADVSPEFRRKAEEFMTRNGRRRPSFAAKPNSTA